VNRATLLELGAILAEAAAAEIMPRFRRLAAADIRTKSGPMDVVTEADEAAERRIGAGVARLLPGAFVLGEEASERDPTLLARAASADLAVIVDPLDGTWNFANGLTLFASMAAVAVRGEIIAAAIHDPVGHDTAFALRGEGAWIEAETYFRDLRVAPPVPVARMTGAASWRMLAEPLRTRIAHRLPSLAASFVYRCAGHEYRLVAGGHCHYVMFSKLMPWDHAPGVLLHREAGGFSARLDQRPYGIGETTGGILCTPDEASFHALHDFLTREVA
jgi:fructose-1,6-bisphosphatase/inositol monophosphatase family enzyme